MRGVHRIPQLGERHLPERSSPARIPQGTGLIGALSLTGGAEAEHHHGRGRSPAGWIHRMYHEDPFGIGELDHARSHHHLNRVRFPPPRARDEAVIWFWRARRGRAVGTGPGTRAGVRQLDIDGKAAQNDLMSACWPPLPGRGHRNGFPLGRTDGMPVGARRWCWLLNGRHRWRVEGRGPAGWMPPPGLGWIRRRESGSRPDGGGAALAWAGPALMAAAGAKPEPGSVSARGL